MRYLLVMVWRIAETLSVSASVDQPGSGPPQAIRCADGGRALGLPAPS